MLNKNPSPEAAGYAVTTRVLAVSRQKLASRAASRLTRLRMSHFDEVDRRKRAERQRGQWTADIKHTEVDREIAGLFDNSANLGLLISVVARVW